MAAHICKSCLRTLASLATGQPSICGECWEKMSPAERANYMQMKELTDSMVELSGQLQDLLGEARRQFESDDDHKPPFWLRN